MSAGNLQRTDSAGRRHRPHIVNASRPRAYTLGNQRTPNPFPTREPSRVPVGGVDEVDGWLPGGRELVESFHHLSLSKKSSYR